MKNWQGRCGEVGVVTLSEQLINKLPGGEGMRDGQISFSVEMGILVIVVLAVLFVIAYHFFPTMFSMSGLLRRILGQ